MTMVYLRSAALLITFTILEVQVLSRLRFFDVAAQLVLAIVVASGLTGGPDRGAIFGFVGGLLLDLYLPTPFGLSAISFALGAWLVGHTSGRIVEESLVTRVGLVAFGSAIATTLYVVGGEALGQSGLFTNEFLRILATICGLNAVLGIVLVPLTSWMWDLSWTERDR